MRLVAFSFGSGPVAHGGEVWGPNFPRFFSGEANGRGVLLYTLPATNNSPPENRPFAPQKHMNHLPAIDFKVI